MINPQKWLCCAAWCVALLLSTQASAQDSEFLITNGSITTCSGFFVDDGNESFYSDTYYTFTICPDNPGDVIQIDFALFLLFSVGNNSDVMTIYDGDYVDDAIWLGSYSGDDLQGLSATGTVNNVSGCLTFVFQPAAGNPSNLPGWTGVISCTTPCSIPVAASVILDPEPENPIFQTVGVCIGQEVTFSDDGSYGTNGFGLETWIWNFDDGTVVETTSPTITHTFSEPGEHIVTLAVEDENGCQSLNIDPLQVLVSTIPDFNTEWTAEVCLGGTGNANGLPVQSVTWTALPPQVSGDDIFISDDLGFLFTNPIVLDFFEPGAVLEDCDDLLSITLNMEHSYMGDLQIQITCPDGTTVILMEYPNGGGGTFLGEPVDVEGDPTPGVGYDYGWSPQANNGTWSDNVPGGFGVSLPEGIYESDYDLCDLVGCPLNGEWVLGITDNLGLDDGNIFEWGLNLNLNLYPDVTTFTPVIGLGPDSSWWEGPFIDWTSADGNQIQFTPDNFGTYEYSFFATNNFSCTFDTTITVEIVPGPTIDAGTDIIFCDGPVQLSPILSVVGGAEDCELTLQMFDSFGDGWNGSNVDIVIGGVILYNFTLPVDQSVGEAMFTVPGGSPIQIIYNEVAFTNEISMILSDQSNGELFSIGPGGFADNQVLYDGVCGGFGTYIYEWSPSMGLSADDILNPTADTFTQQTYTVTVYPDGFLGCAASDEITVTYSNDIDAGDDVSLVICPGTTPFNLFTQLGGDPDAGGIWTDQEGAAVDQLYDPEIQGDGTFTYSVGLGSCEQTSQVEIDVNEFTFTTSADTTVCIGGTASLSVFPDNVPVGPLTFYWEAGQGLGENYTFNPNVSIDNITVYAQYGSNCFTETAVITVELYGALQLAILENETICLGDTIALDLEGIGGGLEPYSYGWTTDGNVFSFDQVPVVQPDLPTQYCLTLGDACETPEVTECVQISLEPIIFPGFDADHTEDCFPLLVNFEGVAGDDDLIAGAEWDFGDGIHNFSIGSAAHNYLSPGYYDVSYTIVSTAGCVYGDTLLNYIHAAPYPNAAFNTEPETAVLPNTTFDFNNLSFDNEFNFWTFGEFGFSEDMEPEFTFPVNVPTQIEVWLYVENEFGCRDSLSRDLLILEEFTLYVPTAFTPDGDGINDFFGIEGVDIDPNYFELRIWNRWGELVYESFDLKQRWIGNFQNGDHFVPDGMYVYQLEAQSLTTGDKKHIFGHVTIVR